MSKQYETISKEQAFMRMARLCSRKECSAFDISQKLFRMNVSEDLSAEIIDRLKDANYINEERFVRSFVKDKLHLNRWGIRKIEQSLRQKHIPRELIDKVIGEYSESELNKSLQIILEKRLGSIRGGTEYEKRGRLIRYALGRGFEMEKIISCLNSMNLTDYNQ